MLTELHLCRSEENGSAPGRADGRAAHVLALGVPWLPGEESEAQHPEATGLLQGSWRGGEQAWWGADCTQAPRCIRCCRMLLATL